MVESPFLPPISDGRTVSGIYRMTDIAPIQDIIAEIRAGRMVVLVDEEDRENEGDLVFAAEFVTPEKINFMAKHGRGLICLTLTEAHCKQLNLPLMVRDNGSPLGTNFTLSIEAASGVTTGISAADRAHTIQVAADKNAKSSDIVHPGHIFPLRAQNGGVLVRAGHTEAGCDLAQLAGLTPASVICEILKDDGEMARLGEVPFARYYGSVAATPLFVLVTGEYFRRTGDLETARAVAACTGGVALDRHLWRSGRRWLCRIPPQERQRFDKSRLEGFA